MTKHSVTMKTLLNILIFGALSMITSNVIIAQDSLSVGAMSYVTDQGDVKLRWAPKNLNTLIYSQSNGYRVRRYPIFHDGVPYGPDDFKDSIVVLGDFFPDSLSSFENSGDNRRELVGEFLFYRDSFTVDTVRDPFLFAENVKSRNDAVYGFPLMLADGDFDLAIDMGLGFIDSSANESYSYVYEFFPIVNDTIHVADTFMLIVDMKKDNRYYEPHSLEYKAVRLDSTVILKWSYPISAEQYTNFVVERSEDNGNSYESLIPDSIILFQPETEYSKPGTFVFKDTVPNPDDEYYYRVRGKTVFGEWGPYSPSLDVVFPFSPTDLLFHISDSEEFDAAKVRLNWSLNMALKDTIDFYQVLWSEDPSAKFELLADSVSKDSFEYVHTTPSRLGNYYRIKAIDKNAYEYFTATESVILVDTTPPQIPIQLEGEISEKGILSISWSPNNDEDIKGYRVFKANAPNAHFVQVTSVPVRDTFYQFGIPINNLSENIYIKIKAVDTHDNSSGLSDFLKLSKPDIIPPPKPLLSLDKVENKQVSLKFITQDTSETDVIAYNLLRRNVQTRFWDTLFVYSPTEMDSIHGIFIDSTASVYETYSYALVAVDEAGNQSMSSELETKVLFQTVEKTIDSLAVSGVDDLGIINLSWKYHEDINRIAGFQIFKKVPSGELRPVRYFPPEKVSRGGGQYVCELEDPKLERDLEFAIKVEFIGGAMSELSPVVSINY